MIIKIYQKVDILTNDSYNKPFNNLIQNITCIVGKNV